MISCHWTSSEAISLAASQIWVHRQIRQTIGNNSDKCTKIYHGSAIKAIPVERYSHLLCWLVLAAAHLLGLKVLVQEKESCLVRFGASHNGEHPLAGLIMRCLYPWVSG